VNGQAAFAAITTSPASIVSRATRARRSFRFTGGVGAERRPSNWRLKLPGAHK
jgi:hypothetical protein